MKAKNGTRPVSRRDAACGTRRAWDVGQRAAEGAGGAGEPDRDDPPEGRERGHSAASGALFQDDVETLAEPAKDLGELRVRRHDIR